MPVRDWGFKSLLAHPCRRITHLPDVGRCFGIITLVPQARLDRRPQMYIVRGKATLQVDVG